MRPTAVTPTRDQAASLMFARPPVARDPSESGGAQLLRLANAESMRLQRESGELPPLPEPLPTARKITMSDIDPQEFGRLQAQVETLLKSDAEKTELLRVLSENVTAMRLQMAEARGGWKALMVLGGASATFGSALTWAWTHLMPHP